MAGIVIVIVGLAATLIRALVTPDQPDEAYFEFGSNVVNLLSIAWIVIVLLSNYKKTDDVFGKAMKREAPTIAMMVLVSGLYSMLKILKSL